jgi:hypothetical protein
MEIGLNRMNLMLRKPPLSSLVLLVVPLLTPAFASQWSFMTIWGPQGQSQSHLFRLRGLRLLAQLPPTLPQVLGRRMSQSCSLAWPSKLGPRRSRVGRRRRTTPWSGSGLGLCWDSFSWLVEWFWRFLVGGASVRIPLEVRGLQLMSLTPAALLEVWIFVIF